MPDRVREAASDAFEIRKYAVAALILQLRDRVGKIILVAHAPGLPGRPGTDLAAIRGICRDDIRGRISVIALIAVHAREMNGWMAHPGRSPRRSLCWTRAI